jgi:hypothetical protein
MEKTSRPARSNRQPYVVALITCVLLLGGTAAIASAGFMLQDDKSATADSSSPPGQSRVVVVQEPFADMPDAGSDVPTSTVKKTKTDLATVQKKLDFQIWLPHELPDGFELDSVSELDGRVDGRGVELTYRKPGSVLFVSQTKTADIIETRVRRDTVLQEVDVNGYHAVLYTLGGEIELPTTSVLTWTDGSRWFEIWGRDAGEMLLVARSLGP